MNRRSSQILADVIFRNHELETNGEAQRYAEKMALRREAAEAYQAYTDTMMKDWVIQALSRF